MSKTEPAARIALRDRGKNVAMRTLILAIASVAALALAGPALGATKTVNIYGSGFSPKSVTITEGDTVNWVNRDNVNHQVYADKGRFVSPIIKPKGAWSFTFRAAGNYNYSDELHPKLTATIVVKGAPPSVLLSASSGYAVAGDKMTLSGTVSSKKPNEQVTIFYQPYPLPSPIQRAVVLTTTGGAFTLNIAPSILTTYQASWNGAYSAPTTIQVQPKLTLGRNNGWIVHAYGAHGFVGKDVQFQRYNGATGQWVTLKKVMLGRTSSAKFEYVLPKGVNRIRLAMSVNEAGAGFLGVVGQPISWTQK